MTLGRRVRAVVLAVLLVAAATLHAQSYDYVVYDPWDYQQLIYQVFYMIQQVYTTIQQYNALVHQYLRLPVDLANRYRGQSVAWTLHDLSAQYARPVLGALNAGDASGTAYRQTVSPLDTPTDVVGRMPSDLQRRLGSSYATIELSDAAARRGIDQVGAARALGASTQQSIRNLELDVASTSDSYQTQTALLQKINSTSVLGLRLSDQTNQFLLSTVEQLAVDTTRKRETEAIVMDATIYQWRYGASYGADLFHRTASALDSWRLR